MFSVYIIITIFSVCFLFMSTVSEVCRIVFNAIICTALHRLILWSVQDRIKKELCAAAPGGSASVSAPL